MSERYNLAGKRVWVAGHRGMAGSALVRRLASEECSVLTVPREKVDLCDKTAVEQWMAAEKPHAIFLAAAKVGGILANDTMPADFIYENLAIQTNIIHAAFTNGVEKLVFLGSSCIYPRLSPQPIQEDALLTGPLEPTNEWYAVAKIAGIKMCQAYRRQHGCDFISAMPTNLIGPGDNYDLKTSHVAPALIRKAHEAKQANAPTLTIWGTGSPRREFLHVDDCADGLVHLMKVYSDHDHVNVGSGDDLPILDLARMIAEVVDYRGEIVFDTSKPDGMPRKLMSNNKIAALGWSPRLTLRDAIRDSYAWYRDNVEGRV